MSDQLPLPYLWQPPDKPDADGSPTETRAIPVPRKPPQLQSGVAHPEKVRQSA